MEYDRRMAKIIFGQEMEPCPKCGSYNIGWQTPIISDITGDESPREMLRKYAIAVKAGRTPLLGPVYIHCRECSHRGPALDCTGRTAEDVGKDPVIAKEGKRLWNNQ